MNSSKAKKIATWIVVPLMAAIFILDIFTVVIGNRYAKKYMPEKETFSYENGDDRIHFLNTGNSDCILLESNGHFAMIDSGEGNSNPRRHNEYRGFEEDVLKYLNKVAVDETGKVHLDFILGTHYHYDHVGSYHRIITDDNIVIERAYFKPYLEEMYKEREAVKWGLKDIYGQIMKDLSDRHIELVSTIPETLHFGDFTLTFFNRSYYEELFGKGENSGSIGIKVEKNGKTAFLAADITGPSGLEDILGEQIGHCDLLKIGHHGYFGSSSMSFLDCLTPEIAIVTNYQGKVYPNVKWNLTMHAKVPFYGTGSYNGIIASFTDDGNIILTDDIQSYE